MTTKCIVEPQYRNRIFIMGEVRPGRGQGVKRVVTCHLPCLCCPTPSLPGAAGGVDRCASH